jgi:hypothetical protein
MSELLQWRDSSKVMNISENWQERRLQSYLVEANCKKPEEQSHMGARVRSRDRRLLERVY